MTRTAFQIIEASGGVALKVSFGHKQAAHARIGLIVPLTEFEAADYAVEVLHLRRKAARSPVAGWTGARMPKPARLNGRFKLP